MCINVYGPVNMLGYGIHNSNVIKALQDNNVSVNLTQIGQTQDCDYYKEYISKAYNNYKSFDKNNPSLIIFHDEYLHQSCGNPIIAYSIFETTKLSERALYNLNNVADKVFTTTQEHKEILINNGVSTPIYVVHEGVDPDLFNTLGDKLIDTGKPTYITVGKCEERKNTDMIITSFIQAMQYKECTLIAHTYNVFTKKFTCKDMEPYFKSLGFNETRHEGYAKWSNGICDILFTRPIDDIKKMKSLYLSANIGIAFSRAEGWDLPLVELLACGIPTITSNVIGHKEYIPGSPKIQQDLLVEPIGMESAVDGIWFHGNKGDWYTMSREDLMEKLEDTYDDIYLYSDPSKELSKYYHDNLGWDKSALKIKELLRL